MKRDSPVALIGAISSADGTIFATGVQFSVAGATGMGVQSTASGGLTVNGAAVSYASKLVLPRTTLIRPKVRALVYFSRGSKHSIKVRYIVAGAATVSAVCTLTVTTAPPHDLALPRGWTMTAGGELHKEAAAGAGEAGGADDDADDCEFDPEEEEDEDDAHNLSNVEDITADEVADLLSDAHAPPATAEES